jgi:acyl-CoA synthetase (AMP-forming)/AMP-acid ligase II
MGFGAAVWEVWAYLTAGASLHIMDEEIRLSRGRLRDWLLDNRITIGFLPPVLAETILYERWSADTPLRAVLTGSDKLLLYPPESLPFKYFNHYGMTEATVISTAAEVHPCNQASTPPVVGRPLANFKIHILDRFFEPVTVKVPGEIFVGGDGLAQGYLNRPDLTAEKFLPDPFSSTPGARLYRTGDLARYSADGQIEFLGRLDFQVNIRGYRIELGEIETALSQFPTIEKAVVVLKGDESSEKHLVAYVASKNRDLRTGEVLNHLRRRLPEYMIPAAIVVLDHIPLTPNGKVDRRSLPEPDLKAARNELVYEPPSNPAQQALSEIWSEVLKVDQVGINDDFIQLGGHSLLATQVIARVRDRFEIDLPVRSVFERPTIKEFAGLVEEVILNEIEAMSPDEARQYL